MQSLLVLRMVEEQFHRDADDDRPVREGRTPAEFLRAGEIEYRTCPYSGSRAGQPMNVSALRQMGARWDEIVDAIAFLRAIYTDARGGAYAPDLLDVWRVSQLGSALPWFHILQAPDARAPAYAAALSKITLGTGIMTQRLYVEQLADRTPPAPLTSAGLLAGAERTGTLVGETEACSASEKMILSFVDVFLEPGRAFAGIGAIGSLAAARGAVLDFGGHYIALKQFLWLSFLARRFLCADLQAALGARDALQELIDAPCEPPDCFTVGPRDLAATALADQIVPLAPDGADRAVLAAGRALAAAMGAAPEADDVADELSRVHGAAPAAARLAARALATYGRLDALLGAVTEAVEAGFRRALGAPLDGAEVPAAVRDRLIAVPVRSTLGALAPATFKSLCLA